MKPSIRTIALVAVVAVACADPSAPNPEGAELVAKNTGQAPTGDHTIRARVVGVDSTPGRLENLIPISGAQVKILLVSVSGTASDSTRGSSGAVPVLVGTLTTNADGRIIMESVVAGFYYLEVTTPAGSPFRGGTSGTVSMAQGNSAEATAFMYKR